MKVFFAICSVKHAMQLFFGIFQFSDMINTVVDIFIFAYAVISSFIDAIDIVEQIIQDSDLTLFFGFDKYRFLIYLPNLIHHCHELTARSETSRAIRVIHASLDLSLFLA
jgi:hypothetical protein